MIVIFVSEPSRYALKCMSLHNNDEIALELGHFMFRLSAFVVHSYYT
jgi:hypothetical protein